ncbi:hypothetical protein ACFWBH_22380 [Streptomyces sp. NPDC059999]|uniref:NucA/NucB deoxyribonuclease domain-containing protein n=1 Tax=Streptomyces sp. NPDC059999 TaxID=3347030 RepID=UPI0036AE6368
MWTDLAVHVVDSLGVEVGRVPFTVKTGILTSHRSGEMRQEFRVDFVHGFLLRARSDDRLPLRLTMKTSSGKYRQGCVVPGITPEFELTASTPEQTWHVQEALRSGLPGAAGRPLHRLADKVKRDINRQKSCPRSDRVSEDRRLTTRSCDEYPCASSREGAASSNGPGRTAHPDCHVPDLPVTTGATGYSVCMIDERRNSRSGSLLGAFYGKVRVIDQDAYTLTASGGTPPPKP